MAAHDAGAGARARGNELLCVHRQGRKQKLAGRRTEVDAPDEEGASIAVKHDELGRRRVAGAAAANYVLPFAIGERHQPRQARLVHGEHVQGVLKPLERLHPLTRVYEGC